MLLTQSRRFTAALMVHTRAGVLLIFHTRMPPSPVNQPALQLCSQAHGDQPYKDAFAGGTAGGTL